MRIIRNFLAALTLAGAAAMVVLAPGAAGPAHSLAGTGVDSAALTSYSVVWDGAFQPTLSQSDPQ